ncbi:hypothetical protein T484DRAFT_1760264, partial [Baffinella frigidus]
TEAGRPFTIQPHVLLRDADAALATNSYALVTASISNDPGKSIFHNPGTTLLQGTKVVRSQQGTARFTDLSINKASIGQGTTNSGYTLIFSYLAASTSTGKFNIRPASWTDLLIPSFDPYSFQPLTSIAGRPLARQPVVYLVDAFKNLVQPSQVPTGTVLRVSISSGVLLADGGVVRYTNLRLDTAAKGYTLAFNTSALRVVSDPFQVVHSPPALLVLTAISQTTPADQPLATQPTVTLVDLFGNPVLDETVHAGVSAAPGTNARGTVNVRLLTPTGAFANLPPLPPAAGQAPNSANMTGGFAYYTDLALRQVLSGYLLEFSVQLTSGTLRANSSSVGVTPGRAAGICNMSLTGRCSAGAPCLNDAEIACIDTFGNVQRACTICDSCDAALVDPAISARCALGKVCTKIIAAPEGGLLSGEGDCFDPLDASPLPCALLTSGAVGARIANVVMSLASPRYQLKFFTLLQDPNNLSSAVEYSYETRPFNVTPPGPMIESVLFSKELHILHIKFDKLTNRNEVPGVAQGENSCSNNLDAAFQATLGTDPRCSWTDRRTLEIVLGAGATVDTATRILLSPLSSITFTSEFDDTTMTSLPATTIVGVIVDGVATGDFLPAFSAALPVPQQVITGTRNLSACQLVNADASLSNGHGGKPFTEIGWTLDFMTSFAEAGILAPEHDAVFLNRYISFSSVLASEVSNTTLKLRPNTPVLPQSFMTISGLPGFAPKYYDYAVLFTTGSVTYGTLQVGVHVGQWQPLANGEAILVLQVDAEAHLPSDADTVLWFEMLNPRFETPRRTPAITVSCFRCSCVGQLSCTLGENVFDMDFPKQPLLIGMDCDVSFGVDDFHITALSSSISEATMVNSAVNNLALSFTTDMDMPSGSSVVLDGFTPVTGGWDGAICLKGRDSDVFDCQACAKPTASGAPARHGYLHKASGRLTMTVRNGTRIHAGREYQVSFEMRNPAAFSRDLCVNLNQLLCPSTTKPVMTLFSPKNARLFASKAPGFTGDLLLQGNVLGAGVISKFTEARVSEGTQVQGLRNMLIFDFAVNEILPKGTMLTISGLKGLVGVASGELGIFSSRPKCFTWAGKEDTGLITITGENAVFQTKISEKCRIEAFEAVQMVFQVMNPTSRQASGSALAITAAYSACASCVETCGCVGRSDAAITVPATAMEGTVLQAASALAFSSVVIAESNEVAGEKNTLRIATAFPIPLLPGSNITVNSSGLTASSFDGAVTIPVTLTLSGAATTLTGRVVNGAVVFTLTARVAQGAAVQIAITLRNRPAPLLAGSVDVMLSADALTDACTEPLRALCVEFGIWEEYTAMERIAPFKATTSTVGSVLLARGPKMLTKLRLVEATTAAKAYNIYTVELRANFDIPGGTSFEFDQLTREEDYFND